MITGADENERIRRVGTGNKWVIIRSCTLFLLSRCLHYLFFLATPSSSLFDTNRFRELVLGEATLGTDRIRPNRRPQQVRQELTDVGWD